MNVRLMICPRRCYLIDDRGTIAMSSDREDLVVGGPARDADRRQVFMADLDDVAFSALLRMGVYDRKLKPNVAGAAEESSRRCDVIRRRHQVRLLWQLRVGTYHS